MTSTTRSSSGISVKRFVTRLRSGFGLSLSTFIHRAGWKSASLYKHIQPSSTALVGSLPVSTNTFNLHPPYGLEVYQSLQTHSTFIHSAGWKSDRLYKHIQPSSTVWVGSLTVSTNTFNLHPQCGLEVCQSLQTHSTFIHSVGWKSASLYKHIQPSSTVWVGSLPVSVIYHINRDHTMATYNWHNGCWARSYIGY